MDTCQALVVSVQLPTFACVFAGVTPDLHIQGKRAHVYIGKVNKYYTRDALYTACLYTACMQWKRQHMCGFLATVAHQISIPTEEVWKCR